MCRKSMNITKKIYTHKFQAFQMQRFLLPFTSSDNIEGWQWRIKCNFFSLSEGTKVSVPPLSRLWRLSAHVTCSHQQPRATLSTISGSEKLLSKGSVFSISLHALQIHTNYKYNRKTNPKCYLFSILISVYIYAYIHRCEFVLFTSILPTEGNISRTFRV